jgi:hypothetical protein
MSEWIDFLVYATQALMLYIALPRWGRRFTRPMLTDRNPQWTAANPEIVAQLENGGWWMKAITTWGIITVLVLLAFRLDLQPQVLTPASLDTPSWEVLMSTSNLLLAVGLVIFFYGLVSSYRWVKRLVPLAERRQATLVPRSLDDFVPRWLQLLALVLVVTNILSRPLVEAFYPGHLKSVWGAFAIQIFMSVLAFLCIVGGVARAPNQFDRALGTAYRRLEVHIGFFILVGLAISGIAYAWLEFSGIDTRRYGAVFTSLCVSAAFAGFILLPVASRESLGPGTNADDAVRGQVTRDEQVHQHE